MNTGLLVDKLIAGYGDRLVLNGVELSAPRGAITALLGRNGSGKSTLLKSICGVLRPRSGSIILDKVDLLRLRPIHRAKKVAYVPQLEHGFGSGLTVFETVAQGVPKELSRKESFNVTANILERLDLVADGLRRAGTLSGGERQRVVIGRALAQGTPFLCLDEPLSNLDVHHQVAVMRLLREFASDGVGVLVVVHDITVAARLADQVIIIDEGAIVAAGKPDTVLQADLLSKVYRAKFDVFYRNGTSIVLPIL